jgi:hypothetical protein
MQTVFGECEIFRRHDAHAKRVHAHRCGRVHSLGDGLESDPAAAETRQLPAEKTEIEDFLHAGGVEHRHHRIHERVLALMRQRRRLGPVVVAGDGEDAPVTRGARGIGVLENVTAAIHARSLAVPHAEHPIETGTVEHVDLLGSPDAGGGEVLVEPGLKADLTALEERVRLPQRLIETSERRAAIAGYEPRGIETGGNVALTLQNEQAHERLNTGEIDTPGAQGVLVVKGDPCECRGHEALLYVICVWTPRRRRWRDDTRPRARTRRRGRDTIGERQPEASANTAPRIRESTWGVTGRDRRARKTSLNIADTPRTGSLFRVSVLPIDAP